MVASICSYWQQALHKLIVPTDHGYLLFRERLIRPSPSIDGLCLKLEGELGLRSQRIPRQRCDCHGKVRDR